MSAIAFLESEERFADAWRWSAPGPLVSLEGDFDTDVFSDFSEQHEYGCDGYDELCSGDGFRWNRNLPELRFT